MLSIIIPSYNQQEYLSDAIESALAQTVNCEVIVVDDGSTDNSLAIAKSYPIRVIEQVNKGLASARNTGIMNAKGDWILLLDADDMLLENAVKKIEETIKKCPDADVIGLSLKTFGSSNQEIILMPNPTIEDFKTGNRLGYCSAIKKEALLAVGGYSPRMVEGWEDYHLWFNLLSRGYKIVTIPEVLWLYRTKSNSMWTDSVKYSDKLWAQIKKDFKLW